MTSVPDPLVLRIRTDGEYIAHEVMRQALGEIREKAEAKPYEFGPQDAAEIAETALVAAAQLEGMKGDSYGA